MHFSNLQRTELVGVASSVLLLLSLLLPWFDLTDTPERVEQNAFICGAGDLTCTAWETFPIFRWLLVAAAAAPLILTYFIIRAQKGKYPTGEFTMTVGFAVIVLVAFNGLLNKPGVAIEEAGISLTYGYWVALLAGFLMAGAGALRSLESGGGPTRRPPGTF